MRVSSRLWLGNYYVWTVESVIIPKAQLRLHRMRKIVSKSLPRQELNLEFHLHLFSYNSTMIWRKFLECIVRANILKKCATSGLDLLEAIIRRVKFLWEAVYSTFSVYMVDLISVA